MRCVICQEEVRTGIDDHIDSHLSVRQDEILEYIRRLSAPNKVGFHKVTCADVRKGEILVSVENAKLFMAFAERNYQIPWEECCQWMVFHEKAHLSLRDLYTPPDVNPNIISNVEDYYIEEYMMPREYRRVYEAHARLIIEIRKMGPLPMIMALRDTDARIYYYLTYAAWYASNVIRAEEMKVSPSARQFVEAVARLMREIKHPEDLSPAISRINELVAEVGH
jgi:hypothetical protein